MEYTEHYDNLEHRELICKDYASRGLRNIHDTFDPDWEKGDEPHGMLTFTDVMPPVEPEPEPLVFEPPAGTGIPEKVEYIEQFLEKLYGRK